MAIPAATGGELRPWLGVLLVALITVGISALFGAIVYFH